MDIQISMVMLIFTAFFIAGLVKGVVGLGLPPLVLGLITATIGIHSAMALVALPSLLTNMAQSVSGPHVKSLLNKHSVFFTTATVSVLLGSWLSTRFDSQFASFVLGWLLIAYALLGILKVRINLSGSFEPTAGIAMGVCNGILTGITGSSAVPGVFYLQSIGLSRDMLIQAMGILFSLSAIALSATLLWRGLLTLDVGILSISSIIPAFFGMALGSVIRKRMPAAVFHGIFFVSLLCLGLYIVIVNY